MTPKNRDFIDSSGVYGKPKIHTITSRNLDKKNSITIEYRHERADFLLTIPSIIVRVDKGESNTVVPRRLTITATNAERLAKYIWKYTRS